MEAFEPEVHWMYWIGDKENDNVSVKITVKDKDGKSVATLEDKGNYGL